MKAASLIMGGVRTRPGAVPLFGGRSRQGKESAGFE